MVAIASLRSIEISNFLFSNEIGEGGGFYRYVLFNISDREERIFCFFFFFFRTGIYHLKRLDAFLSTDKYKYTYIGNKLINDNRSWPMYRASASHDTDHIILF